MTTDPCLARPSCGDLFLSWRSRAGSANGTPQGLKPSHVAGYVAKAKALAYLESISARV